jgi:hypothetical protein
MSNNKHITGVGVSSRLGQSTTLLVLHRACYGVSSSMSGTEDAIALASESRSA